MIRALVVAGLLAASALPARAVDAALFNGVAKEIAVESPEKYDERAILAGLLSRPDEAAAFEAEARESLNDPALRALLIGKWRGRVAAFAETESHRPALDESLLYHNWKEVVGREGYAYIIQRLKTMLPEKKQLLLEHLGRLDDMLKESRFKIVDYTLQISPKKVSDGLRAAYVKDLGAYLSDATTKAAAAAAPAASTALAGALAKRRASPAPPAGTALEQAQIAAAAGQGAGAVFDGGTGGGDFVAAGGAGTSGPRRPPYGLSPSTRRSSLSGSLPEVPAPAIGEDDIDAQIAGARQSKLKSAMSFARVAAGAALGALLGFLAGGPFGAILGAAVLGGAVHFLTKK
ncbi:MAG: hypothetical protein HYZ74_08060 [Elusimicrobia bacterium]|nr:hypothetical protein [Elusimicrobiota bacterium]